QGWLESLSPLVSTSEAALRAKARSLSVGARGGCLSEPVTSGSCILAKASSVPLRDRLQPLEASPIRNSVIRVPPGPIADRPTRRHVLYRGCLYSGGSALWAAGGRN